MNIKLVSRSISVITKLREIYKNDKDRSDQISEYA
jgi:hypothetical protein